MTEVVSSFKVNIASGSSLSGEVLLDNSVPRGKRLFAIVMPSSWTAANLTFQASIDGTTYNNLYDYNGSEVTVTAAASRYIVLDPLTFAGVAGVKIRSGTSGTPVNQGADRTLTLVVRDI